MDHLEPRVPTRVDVRHLFIVSRQAPALYHRLTELFAAEPDFGAILDRRTRERCAGRPGRTPERRARPWVEEELSAFGCAFVSIPGERHDGRRDPRPVGPGRTQ